MSIVKSINFTKNRGLIKNKTIVKINGNIQRFNNPASQEFKATKQSTFKK